MSKPIICAVCRNALDICVTPDGVARVHTLQDPDDHEPVPVEAPPWWRGRCDFCSDRPAVFVLPVRSFRVPGSELAQSDEDWSACANCGALIERNDWDQLRCRVASAMAAASSGAISEDYWETVLSLLHAAIRANITGPLKRIEDGQ